MKKNIVLYLFCLFFGYDVIAQNLAKLKDHGFENLTEFYTENEYSLSYENNRYRFEADALSYIIQNLTLNKSVKSLRILILNQGIGIVKVEFTQQNYKRFLNKELDPEAFIEKMSFSFDIDALESEFNHRKKTNRSYKKVDIITGLAVDYTLGNFDNSIRQKINIQPQISTTLGKGTFLTAQYNIPTFNELDNEENRPIMIALSKDLRFKENTFMNINAGFFNQNRFGIHAILRQYIDDERLFLDVQYGVTRNAYLASSFKLFQNNLQTQVYSAGLSYRINTINSDVSFRYGSFYSGDIGYKFRFTRYFEEVSVGLFLDKTNFGSIAGFDFQVPFLQKKYLRPKRIRIRSRESFGLIYNYISDTNIAREYTRPYSILNDLTEYYPHFLSNALVKRLKKSY